MGPVTSHKVPASMKKVLVKIWLKITTRAEIFHSLYSLALDNQQEENNFLISQKTFPDCNFKYHSWSR